MRALAEARVMNLYTPNAVAGSMKAEESLAAWKLAVRNCISWAGGLWTLLKDVG